MDQENRVVVLIDMDCFYCQVEEKLDPELKGKPIAVVQYNPWKGGGIIAVNYVARARGVTRHMRGDEAKEKCPEIVLPSVPCQRGKADISKYRDAGKEVAKVLQKFTPLLERASIDEAYLDITAPVHQRLKSLDVNSITTSMMPNTYALGYEDIDQFVLDVHTCGSDSIDFEYEHAKQLLVGAVIVSEIRAAVYDETGYQCSAGIAHNKILAKLVCGMNKPNKQTILPKHSVNILYKTLSVKKVKHLGGKFGDTVCQVLKVKSMSELQTFSEKELQVKFDEKNGTWLYNIARGIDLEPVQARFNPKSIGCCKNFKGKSALLDLETLRKWLNDLGDEIEDRLEKDALESNRTPRQVVVSFTQLVDGRDVSCSRSYNFSGDDELNGVFFSNKALELLMESAEGAKPKDDESNRKLKAPITFLGISVGKFEDNSDNSKTKKISDYFSAGTSNLRKPKENIEKDIISCKSKKNEGKDYILKKFFQPREPIQDKDNSLDLQEKVISKNTVEITSNSEPVLESPLEQQESFFAKLLNGGLNLESESNKDNLQSLQKNTKDNIEIRSTTPICKVLNRGEDSNDTDYSGSTINMEINKSIALFEDDPDDVARVSGMRELLNTSTVTHEDTSTDTITTNPKPIELDQVEAKQIVEVIESNIPQTFECTECRKAISVSEFEEHADYHLALKLRNEERDRIRKEFKEKSGKTVSKKVTKSEELKKRKSEEVNKNDVTSISNFLVKLDESVPLETCTECKRRVPVQKLAEHLDFHEAQKLNRELNKKEPRYPTGNNFKRKKKSVSPVKKPKMPCYSRSIDSFFR